MTDAATKDKQHDEQQPDSAAAGLDAAAGELQSGFEGREKDGRESPGYSSQGTKAEDTPADGGRLNPLQVISSVFAAGLGVQSSKNRERDFKQGRAGIFIVAGLLFTALFIGGVYTVVSLVLSTR